MYELYKKKTVENVTKKWDDYGIKIPSNIADNIKKYTPVKR